MAFRKPATKLIGAKILAYGSFGSGKSIFGLSFPKVAAIDSENGLTNYENSSRGSNIVMIDNTQSFKELEDSIDYIADTFKDEGVETLVIDSETKIYNNIEQAVMTVEEKRARSKGRDVDDTNLSMRSYGRIRYVGTKLQNLKIDLTSQGVHVVSVAQAKPVKKKVGDEFVVDHYVPSMNKDAEYDYDIVVFFWREEDLINGGYKYFARVEKDRTETFKAGTVVEGGVSYENWREYYEGMADSGKEVLGSNFSEDINKGIESYDKDSKLEAQEFKTQVMDIMKSLKADELTTFKKEFAALKVTNFEEITVNQQKKLENLITKYK